jgi:hypothetical protein
MVWGKVLYSSPRKEQTHVQRNLTHNTRILQNGAKLVLLGTSERGGEHNVELDLQVSFPRGCL